MVRGSCFLLSSLLACFPHNSLEAVTEGCTDDNQCGWNALCAEGSCVCIDGYEEGYNGKDCVDTRCGTPNCVLCASKSVCKRCIDYIEGRSGRCLTTCDSLFSLIIDGDYQGKVCEESEGHVAMTYIALIIAISAGILMSCLLSGLCYFKFRTDRERQLRLKIFGRMMEREAEIQELAASGQTMRQTSPGGSKDGNIATANLPPVNRMKYVHQVTALQPKQDLFLEMLSKARLKAHALPPDDDKCCVFINLATQLSRVVQVLSEPDGPVPTDGNFLLDWAQRLLAQYEERRPACLNTPGNDKHEHCNHQTPSPNRLQLQKSQDAQSFA